VEAYLDNSATTRCTEAVREVVVRTMMEDYGNPSSKHMKGVEAERYLREARETIAKTLKVHEKEIYFTSGATESNNWALIGAAMANQRAGKHLITTAVEHAAVLLPLHYLEEQGFSVKRADREDIKRILAVYYEQNVTTERFEDFDGERWIMPED